MTGDSRAEGRSGERYGKGVYIYDAFAFYRELPLGIPGAFRIFLNLLSLPDNPEVQHQAK